MLVSLHITYKSAGGIEGFTNIIPNLNTKLEEYVKSESDISEHVIIQTCNRLEAYIVTCDECATVLRLNELVKENIPFNKEQDLWYTLKDRDSIHHLFRVICGIESFIAGEDQIQHQVKESYGKAKENGHIDKMLSILFDKALSVGKRVRTETELNKGAVSVGSAAVQLAEEIIGPLDGKNITILGAGDMASVIAKNLVGKNPKVVFVSSRTYERAVELANELNGIAMTMEMRIEAISQSDLVLVAVSAPHYIIRKEDLIKIVDENKRKTLFIDVSVPRNVEDSVTEIEGVSLATMDSLNEIALKNINKRRSEIIKAEKIIEEELKKVDIYRKEQIAAQVIREIELKLAIIKSRELEIAKSKKDSVDTDKLLEDFSKALLSKITCELYGALKEASREGNLNMCNSAIKLFNLKDVK